MSEPCAAHEMMRDEILHLRENQGRIFDRTEETSLGLADAKGDIRLITEIVSRVETELKGIAVNQDAKMDEIIVRIGSIPRPTTHKSNNKRWIAAIVAASLGSGGLGSVASAIIQASTRLHSITSQADQYQKP